MSTDTTIKRVDHIGIAVESIQAALGFYRDALGMELGDVHTVEEQGVRVAFLPAGDSAIELLEPLNDASNTKKFLENRGEGIHHICLEVEDIGAALERLAAAGYRLIDITPRQGAHGKIAFVHPKSAHGVLLELMELSELPERESH